jgi:hypothetical protein
MREVVDSRYISVPEDAMLDGTQTQKVRFRRRRRLGPSCRRRGPRNSSTGLALPTLPRRCSYLLTVR